MRADLVALLPELVLAALRDGRAAGRTGAADSAGTAPSGPLPCSRSPQPASRSGLRPVPPTRRRALLLQACSRSTPSRCSSRSCSCSPRRLALRSRWTTSSAHDYRPASTTRCVLFATIGMMGMASGTNLATIYVGLELMALSTLRLGRLLPPRGQVARGGSQVLRARRAVLRGPALRHLAASTARPGRWTSAVLAGTLAAVAACRQQRWSGWP